MAAKKFYAVKKGKVTGIFDNWNDCKASVDGFSGAEYKGYPTLEEAKQYLGLLSEENTAHAEWAHEQEPQKQQGLVVYVDGSYEDSVKRYAFGCVFLHEDGTIYVEFGNGNNPQSLQHRNVTGEMLGAMYAVRTAMMNGYGSVELYYDYEGIEKWVTGAWKAKNDLTQKYALSMQEWGKSIRIGFHKVAAHTNVTYNELADQMAKRGLVEGTGVPKVRKFSEMTKYEG